MPGGLGGVTEAEFEIPEGRGRPDLVQPHPEVRGELQGFGGAAAALLLASLTGLQPGQASQAERQLGPLPALPGQVDRFLVAGLGDRPPVGGGLIAGDQVEHERERADGGAGPGGAQYRLQQRALGAGLAQEQRSHGQPRHQLEILTEVGRVLGELRRVVQGFRAGRRVAAEDPRHPGSHGGHEAGAYRGIGGQRGAGPLRGHQHLGWIARVEAGVGGLGEHDHGPFGVGALGRGGQDRVAPHHRAAAGRDVPRQGGDLHQHDRVTGDRAGLVQQRDRPVGQPGEPARLRRIPEEAAAPAMVRGQPSGPFVCRRGGRVRAAVPAAGPGLLQGRRRGLVRPGRRRGQMPGAAVHVQVGQGARERPVRVAPLPGRRVRVDGRAGQRVAEFHPARIHHHQPRGFRVR